MMRASELRKTKILEQDWIDKRWEDIEKNTTGRKVFYIGTHVTTTATSKEFIRQLIANGFMVSHDVNEHGVKLLIVE